jgi:hypothetical protein
MTSDKAEFSFTPTDEAAAKYSVTVEVKITVTKTDPSPAPSLDYVIGDSATWVCQEQEVRSQQDTSSRWVCSDTSYYRQQMVWRDTTIFLRNEYRVSVDTNHFTLSYGYGYVYDSIMRGEWNPTYPELLEYYNSHGGHCEWLYDYASDFRCTSPSVVGGFVDTMPVVYGNIRRDTSMVRIDSTISYESMENVRVDTQYCRQQVERLTDTAINNITTTLRFTQSAAILSVQHSNPYSYNQYNGQYAYPYDGKAGRMSVKFDAQEWHYQGSVTATSMLLQNNGAGKVQRFVRR